MLHKNVATEPSTHTSVNRLDIRALLKAKYCPRVAAVSCTQKQKKNQCDLTSDLWPWYSTGFWRLSRYMFVQNFIKLSAVVRELSCWQRKKLSDDAENNTAVQVCQFYWQKFQDFPGPSKIFSRTFSEP